jgi:hypothetical protein
LDFILKQCPNEICNKFTNRSRSVLIALTILLVENPKKPPNIELLNYLLRILADLPNAKWTNTTESSINSLYYFNLKLIINNKNILF